MRQLSIDPSPKLSKIKENPEKIEFFS